jgi:hypothetical protein
VNEVFFYRLDVVAVCDGLRALGESMASYAGSFDVSVLNGDQAADVVGLCARIEASAAAVKALAAARSAEAGGWQGHGYRSAAEQLADQAGMSPGAAKRVLRAGQRMAEQPGVARTALGGELSAEQAAAVAEGVAADPAKAAELIDTVRRASMPELNEQVSKVKAAAADAETRWRQVHAGRALRRWTDRDGVFQARLSGHPEDGAGLWRMLDPVRRRLNLLRRQVDPAAPVESLDALDYDALVLIASVAAGKDGEVSLADLVGLGLFPQLPDLTRPAPHHPPEGGPAPPDSGRCDLLGAAGAGDAPAARAHDGGRDPLSGPAGPPPDGPGRAGVRRNQAGRRAKKLAGSPMQLMIRVDFDALFRGVALEGELCEIAGFGPIPVAMLEALLATENPFIIGLLTKAHTLTGVYHHGRRPNTYQRSALDFLHPTCAVE